MFIKTESYAKVEQYYEHKDRWETGDKQQTKATVPCHEHNRNLHVGVISANCKVAILNIDFPHTCTVYLYSVI